MGGAADPGAPRPYEGGGQENVGRHRPRVPLPRAWSGVAAGASAFPLNLGPSRLGRGRLTGEAGEGDLLDRCPCSSPPQAPRDSW